MTKTDYIYRYNLNRLRKEHGITYQKLSELTGMDTFYLIKMHNYKSPAQPRWCFDRFEAFATIYGIEVYELFIPPKDIAYPDDLDKSCFICFDENG